MQPSLRPTDEATTEITERAAAARKLSETERCAQSTIEALSFRLCVLDETGTILTTNDAWRQFAEAHPDVRLHRPRDDGHIDHAARDISRRAQAETAEDAFVHHGFLKPGIAFLYKPFTAETLGRKIHDVLNR